MADLKMLAADMIPADSDYLWFYQTPVMIQPRTDGMTIDYSSQADPLMVLLLPPSLPLPPSLSLPLSSFTAPRLARLQLALFGLICDPDHEITSSL